MHCIQSWQDIGLNKCDTQAKICTEWKQWDSTSALGTVWTVAHTKRR